MDPAGQKGTALDIAEDEKEKRDRSELQMRFVEIFRFLVLVLLQVSSHFLAINDLIHRLRLNITQNHIGN